MEPRKRLGEIFVDQCIITVKTVDRVLARSRVLNRRFGTILEEMELITGEELAVALGIQYGYKVVANLIGHAYPPELLQLIPVEVAMQHLLFPLRRDHDRLALAMADPTDTAVVSNIAANNGLKIVPFVAPRKDIFDAVSRHYLGREPVGETARTVLIVDDDILILAQLAETLTSNGYRVVKATDGLEAFKTVIAEKPHVIVSDMVMPKLDGYGLLEALQKVPETMFIPVILITGVKQDEEAQAFRKGFFDFITKPVSEVTLLTRVKRAFFFHEHHYRLL
jgi:CheY-like chemotaxis protein